MQCPAQSPQCPKPLQWSAGLCVISSSDPLLLTVLLIVCFSAHCFLSSWLRMWLRTFACVVPLPGILFSHVPAWLTSSPPVGFYQLSPAPGGLPDYFKITKPANPALLHSWALFSCSINLFHSTYCLPHAIEFTYSSYLLCVTRPHYHISSSRQEFFVSVEYWCVLSACSRGWHSTLSSCSVLMTAQRGQGWRLGGRLSGLLKDNWDNQKKRLTLPWFQISHLWVLRHIFF